ncbi:outer membrane protein assembly factor BamD [Kiritimatiellota bacterium B12222]|nr:outer membrane protein assembly factor BamD [Kiritimatiellota bacterium B12222]
MIRAFLISIFAFSLLSSLPASAKEREVYDESISSTRDFSLFGGPSKKGPEYEWKLVNEYISKNKLKKAIKHAGYITKAWPDHALAVDAQRMIGDLQFSREEYAKAFEAYQGLIDNYVGSFNYEEILDLQLECARRTQYYEYKSFFGLTSYTDPIEAVPLYRQLLTNAPHMDAAPQILFDLGTIYLQEGQQLNAIQEFNLLEQRYPDSPLSEKSVIRKADAFAKLSKRNPTDIRPIEGELETLNHFISVYPDSDNIQEIRIRRKNVYEQVAGVHFELGNFYEKNLRRPDAALVTYRSLLEQFPDSEWTVPAKERILALSQKEN